MKVEECREMLEKISEFLSKESPLYHQISSCMYEYCATHPSSNWSDQDQFFFQKPPVITCSTTSCPCKTTERDEG